MKSHSVGDGARGLAPYRTRKSPQTPHGDAPTQGADHDRCRTSADGPLSHITRRSTTGRHFHGYAFLYWFKGSGSAGARLGCGAALARRPRRDTDAMRARKNARPLAVDSPVAARRVKSAHASLRDRASSTLDTLNVDLRIGSYEGTGPLRRSSPVRKESARGAGRGRRAVRAAKVFAQVSDGSALLCTSPNRHVDAS